MTGFFHQDRDRSLVVPEDPRFPFVIEIKRLPKSQEMPENGDAVLVRLDPSHHPTPTPRGAIVEVLGNPDLLEVQIRMVAEKHQLPFQFSPEALLEAERSGAGAVGLGREDLRDILHYTIDGADAKDFDDAVAVTRLENGYRLHVSIADVSAYVKPGSKLDQEAYERGNSVYFPAFVIPMLPENLSNNLCSLVPGEDRLTVTAVLDFDRSGALLNKRFVRSIIRSSKRFTYDTVKRIVVDKDKKVRQEYKPFLTPLTWAAELAEALQIKRRKRGSVTLTISEPDIRLDSGGGVEEIGRKERSFADQIIEEFMLAANEAVAATFADKSLDLLYRIHEEPDLDKISEFVDLAATFGLEIPKGKPTPFWYNKIAAQVEGTPREHIVNSQLLRTLQQARYASINSGHFGIGAPNYTHFTSPIRRYPDLIVHRLLCDLIAGNDSEKATPYPYRSLKEAGLHLSERERVTVTAERDMADRLKCRYMRTRIGERFRAIVSAIGDTLFFVDLLDHFISGSVLLSSLTDDYYLHDWKNHRLIGDISGRIIRVGDLVQVQLIDVETASSKIFFTLSAAKENHQ